jgi:hypothetical protein
MKSSKRDYQSLVEVLKFKDALDVSDYTKKSQDYQLQVPRNINDASYWTSAEHMTGHIAVVSSYCYRGRY